MLGTISITELSLIYQQPCDAQCELSSCHIDTSYYQASCRVDDTSSTSIVAPVYVGNYGASTTSSDSYSYYRASTTSSDPYSDYRASSTSEEGSYETEQHRSSSSKSTEENSNTLPPKVIGGIVIGVVAFFSAIGAALTWLFRRRKRSPAAPGATTLAIVQIVQWRPRTHKTT